MIDPTGYSSTRKEVDEQIPIDCGNCEHVEVTASPIPGGALGALFGSYGGAYGRGGTGHGPIGINVNGYHGRVTIGKEIYDVYAQQLEMSPFQQLLADISVGQVAVVTTSNFSSMWRVTGLAPIYSVGRPNRAGSSSGEVVRNLVFAQEGPSIAGFIREEGVNVILQSLQSIGGG